MRINPCGPKRPKSSASGRVRRVSTVMSRGLAIDLSSQGPSNIIIDAGQHKFRRPRSHIAIQAWVPSTSSATAAIVSGVSFAERYGVPR